MRDPMRAAAFAVALVLLGCSSPTGSVPAPVEAGADGDAADPFADVCKKESRQVPGDVVDCVGPCGTHDLAAGASCFDLPVGFVCERGDHPDPQCNALLRCNSNYEWDAVRTARTTGKCATIVSGVPCESRAQCPPQGAAACLADSPYVGKLECVALPSQSDDCSFVGHSRPRIGCGCADGVALEACSVTCESGRVVPGDCLRYIP